MYAEVQQKSLWPRFMRDMSLDSLNGIMCIHWLVWLVLGVVTFIGLCFAPRWTSTVAFPWPQDFWFWFGKETALLTGAVWVYYGVTGKETWLAFTGLGILMGLVMSFTLNW